MAFLPRSYDTLFLHQHDKNLHIEFEDFSQVLDQARKWLIDWQETNKPISLEEFVVEQESFLKRQYGDAQVELAKTYVLAVFDFSNRNFDGCTEAGDAAKAFQGGKRILLSNSFFMKRKAPVF